MKRGKKETISLCKASHLVIQMPLKLKRGIEEGVFIPSPSNLYLQTDQRQTPVTPRDFEKEKKKCLCNGKVWAKKKRSVILVSPDFAPMFPGRVFPPPRLSFRVAVTDDRFQH